MPWGLTPLWLSGGAETGLVDFETRAIHKGQEPDPATGAITTPIYQTSTYVQEGVGKNKGYDYSRAGNPTRTALETCLSSLESADHGVAFSSGLGGVTTLMHLVSPGERVVSVNDVYGGVYRMFSQVYEPKGYAFTFLSAQEIGEGLSDHIDDRTRLVWLESPTNPLLNLIDIETAANAAHAKGAIVVVDNTFATPYLQRPLELGADVVVHSTTKYLGGHSTSSAASSRRTTPPSPSDCGSCKSRSEQSRARSTAGSSSAA
jgi:cystathionine gamma-lyase